LSIEVAYPKGVVISQRKYLPDIPKETGMIDCRSVDSPMDPNQKLMAKQSEYLFILLLLNLICRSHLVLLVTLSRLLVVITEMSSSIPYYTS